MGKTAFNAALALLFMSGVLWMIGYESNFMSLAYGWCFVFWLNQRKLALG